MRLTKDDMLLKDLRSSLNSELSFNFLRLMTALTWTHHEFLACELHDATKGLGTREQILIEILCSSRNHDIASIKTAYRQRTHQSHIDCYIENLI